MAMARLTQISLVTMAFAMGCEAQGGETIGPRGGMVVSDDGRLSLDVRPGALEDDVDITIDEIDCGEMDIAAVGPCYEVGPRGTAFLFPAKLTYELDDADLDGADDLAFSVQREEKWKLLADRVVDLEDGTLTGSAIYLSSFAIVSVQ
jgi:hypothetical protein